MSQLRACLFPHEPQLYAPHSCIFHLKEPVKCKLESSPERRKKGKYEKLNHYAQKV